MFNLHQRELQIKTPLGYHFSSLRMMADEPWLILDPHGSELCGSTWCAFKKKYSILLYVYFPYDVLSIIFFSLAYLSVRMHCTLAC